MSTRPSFPVSHPLSRHVLAVVACLAMTAFPAMAATEDEANATPNPGERIKQLRDEGESLRTKAEADYQATETACYKRFLVNRCIDEAKAKRLETISRARELEAEAHQEDLAERRRKAAEVAKKAEERGNEPRSTEASAPSADRNMPKMPPLKAATPRARRSSQSNTANSRTKATQRAEAARRDRERYDARIRELEEKKARDADGR